jgi:H+/Cl- antiporter ClcA
VPGLLGAGIGSLVSIGMGSWTGLSTSAYALGPLALPALARPDAAEIAWAIPLAAVIGVGAVLVFRAAQRLATPAGLRPWVVLPAIALLVGGLAILFDQVTGKGTDQVLFSGQDALPGLIAAAPHWSLGTVLLLIACKGIAYSVSLAGFRGGPVFPALFLGAAAGIAAAGLPGMSLTAGVAAGLGAGAAAALRLPLSAVVLAVLLTGQSGAGAQPVAIVAAAVAYLVAVGVSRRLGAAEAAAPAR